MVVIDPQTQGQRIDKWLWFARFVKSRTLAADLASSGRIRLTRSGNDVRRISRPSDLVRPGDVLTLRLGARVRVVRVESMGVRRGAAAEGRALYCDLTLEQPADGTA